MQTMIPVIETERLRLRAIQESDFEAYAGFYASEGARYYGGSCDRNDAWRRMASFIGHWSLRGYGVWALEEKASGAFIGQAGLWFPEGWPDREITWMLLEGHQGRGLATEAALRVRAHAFEMLGWKRVVSCIQPANAPSIRLAKRLGAVYESSQSIPGRDFDLYRHEGSQPSS